MPLLEKHPELSSYVQDYEAARSAAVSLLQGGLDQGDLSALSRSVPDLFPRHRDWAPPRVQGDKGRWLIPRWFVEVDDALQRVLRVAEQLRTVGYY